PAAPYTKEPSHQSFCPCALSWRFLMSVPDAGLQVELLDQTIPRGNAADQLAPESLVLATIEVVDCHPLLFHPRVIAKVEDALAIEMSKLEDVIVHDAFQMTAVDLAGIHFIEPLGIAPRQEA